MKLADRIALYQDAPTKSLAGILVGFCGAGRVGRNSKMPDIWQFIVRDNANGEMAVYTVNPLIVIHVNQCCKIGDMIKLTGRFMGFETLSDKNSRLTYFADHYI